MVFCIIFLSNNNYEGVTDEEVSEIYEEADLDKDNRLSFDEYLDIALKIEDEVSEVDKMMAQME